MLDKVSDGQTKRRLYASPFGEHNKVDRQIHQTSSELFNDERVLKQSLINRALKGVYPTVASMQSYFGGVFSITCEFEHQQRQTFSKYDQMFCCCCFFFRFELTLLGIRNYVLLFSYYICPDLQLHVPIWGIMHIDHYHKKRGKVYSCFHFYKLHSYNEWTF